MKKYILIALAVFGFNALAGMSGMAGQSDSAEGFNGSVELKWRYADSGWGNFTYRGRVGWTGSVNDAIQWGAALTTPIEAQFGTYGLGDVDVEQFYVKYSPVEAFYIKAGKYEYYSNFNKYGVLVDDDLYAEGVKVKFHHEVAPAIHIYAKVSVEQTGDYAGVWGDKDGVTSGWAGVKSDGDWKYGVGVGAQSNTFPAGGDKSLIMAKVSAGSSDLAGVPAGVFGFWSSDAGEIGAGTYSVGAHVGDTSETHGWGVTVNYYNITDGDWNSALVDTDYIAVAQPAAKDDEEGDDDAVASTEGNGVAVKAQYNPWDNTNVAVKYNMTMGDSATHGVVGEVTFKF